MTNFKNPDRPEKKADEVAFETWLDQRVRALYQSVLEEPLPEDMIRRLKRQTHS